MGWKFNNDIHHSLLKIDLKKGTSHINTYYRNVTTHYDLWSPDQ